MKTLSLVAVIQDFIIAVMSVAILTLGNAIKSKVYDEIENLICKMKYVMNI